MMQDVDYLVIALRNEYRINNIRTTKSGDEVVKVKTNYDFEEVCKFFDALYSTERLKLPLKGILIIVY